MVFYRRVSNSDVFRVYGVHRGVEGRKKEATAGGACTADALRDAWKFKL